MSAQEFLDISITIGLAILSLSFLVTIYRIVVGPTLPDRILGLDLLVAVAIGYIAIIGIKTGYTLYVDIAIALGLVGFLATVAFARFILFRGRADQTGQIDKHEDEEGANAAEKGQKVEQPTVSKES